MTNLILYFHIPFTAGHSIREFIASRMDGDEVMWVYDTPDNIVKKSMHQYPNADLNGIISYVYNLDLYRRDRIRLAAGRSIFNGFHHLLGPDIDTVYITSVRHPVDMLISAYNFSRNFMKEEAQFKEWAKDKDGILINSLINNFWIGGGKLGGKGPGKLDLATSIIDSFDYIILFDDMFSDARMIMYEETGILITLPDPKINATPHYSKITDEDRTLAAEVCKQDIALYKYAKDINSIQMESMSDE